MKTVSVLSCLSPNFGDALGPWLVGKISERKVVWARKDADWEHFVTCGSILNWSNAHSVVWGSGLASMGDEVHPQAKIRSVRDPFSAMRARMCGAKVPDVFGDPAFVLPRFVKAADSMSHPVGVVPHYVDQLRAYEWWGESKEIKIIDILGPIEEVVKEITSCGKIVSSSLHGGIVADAYGIPNVFCKLGDSLGGDGVKFFGYRLSVKRASRWDEPKPILDFREGLKGPDWWKRLPYECGYDGVKELVGPLMEACPFTPEKLR